MRQGQRVKHIKSDGKLNWYRRLNNGVVEDVSKSGKTATVSWYNEKGRRLHWAQYLIANLVKIDKPT